MESGRDAVPLDDNEAPAPMVSQMGRFLRLVGVQRGRGDRPRGPAQGQGMEGLYRQLWAHYCRFNPSMSYSAS
jgi:hypothetical protein